MHTSYNDGYDTIHKCSECGHWCTCYVHKTDLLLNFGHYFFKLPVTKQPDNCLCLMQHEDEYCPADII